jgi:hypothetical protein
MLNKFCSAILPTVSNCLKRYLKNRAIAVVLLLLTLNAGCSRLSSSELEMSIQVEPLSRPGIYSVSGTTNLPEGSIIEASAIRYLQPQSKLLSNRRLNPPYSILSRQLTRVEQGKWRAKLNLWQVATDGSFKETWQLNPSETLDPSQEVVFLAVVNPNSQTPKLKRQLEAQAENFADRFVQFTSEGQWYIQAAESFPLSLPVGKTTPPPLRAENINDGWGDRSVVRRQSSSNYRPSPPSINTKQTTAPLSPSEMLN